LNIRLPKPLEKASKEYVKERGYKNVQELIHELLRERVLGDGRIAGEFSELEHEIVIALEVRPMTVGEISELTGKPKDYCMKLLKGMEKKGHVKELGKKDRRVLFSRA